MAANTVDQIKAWATPALLLAVLALSGFIWTEQQGRIKTLEETASTDSSALAVIAANQATSLADRTDFQIATTSRLSKIDDTLTAVGQSLAALTALQQLSSPRLVPNRLPQVQSN